MIFSNFKKNFNPIYIAFIFFITFSVSACAQNKDTDKQKIASFLTLSDIHFDPFYTCEQSQSSCPLIQQLRQADASAWPAILAKYDNGSISPYKFDSNYPLLKSALATAQQQAQQSSISFVLILGDFIAHNFQDKFRFYTGDFSQTDYQDFVKKDMEFLTHEIKQTFPNIPVYPLIGNNDSYSGNYTVIINGPFFKDLTQLWSSLVGNPQFTTFSQTFPVAGYYAVTPPNAKQLRLILLNTVLFSNDLTNDVTQPAQQELVWLRQQLALANAQQQKVWILSHIPPGINIYNTVVNPNHQIIPFWQDAYNKAFLNILRDYDTIIAGIITSHVHMDGFQIIPETRPLVDTFASSVSPLFGNNSSFKIYNYATDTLQLKDFITYYLNNGDPSKGWQLEYNFNQIYQPNCTACQLLHGMQKLQPQGSLAQSYQLYYAVGDNSQPITQGKWYPYYWCGLDNQTEISYQDCLSKLQLSKN